MVPVDPGGAGVPVRGMTLPTMSPFVHPLPVRPAKERHVQVAPGKAADLLHHGRTAALPLFELVGQEHDLREHRHRRGTERVIAYGGKCFVVGDCKAFAEDNRRERAMQHDRCVLVGRGDGDTRFARKLEQLRGRMGAEEVMAPDGELGAFRVDVPPPGQVERFDQHALNVTDQPLGARLQFAANPADLMLDVRAH